MTNSTQPEQFKAPGVVALMQAAEDYPVVLGKAPTHPHPDPAAEADMHATMDQAFAEADVEFLGHERERAGLYGRTALYPNGVPTQNTRAQARANNFAAGRSPHDLRGYEPRDHSQDHLAV